MAGVIDLRGGKSRSRQNVNNMIQQLIQQKISDSNYRRGIEREDMKMELNNKQRDNQLQNQLATKGWVEAPEGVEGTTPFQFSDGVKYYKQKEFLPEDMTMQQIGQGPGGNFYMQYDPVNKRFVGTPQYKTDPGLDQSAGIQYATDKVKEWQANNPGKEVPAGTFGGFLQEYKRAQAPEVYRTTSAKEQAQTDYIGAKTSAKKQAEWQVERQKALPAVKQKYGEQVREWDLLEERIDKAINEVSPYTAGFGSWFKGLPTSKAKTLAKDLETIAANISFEKLQKMREASPTGGALGQVSDFENRLLQATKGSLEQSLSAAELKGNLEIIMRYLKSLRADTEKAYYNDYGDLLVVRGQAQQPAPQSTAPPAPQPEQVQPASNRKPLSEF